ncbi:MAG: FadR family transcriptional regulator [Anaerolineales bacterium]|nr:FadR family transcriptional regulator [Anaerolineales bacterium]
MDVPIAPLKVLSLKEACVARLEALILSGELHIGERLPPERDFALRLGVSRPVLHEALVDLAGKGLVEILPRRGVFVSDYRRDGSLAMLTSLLAHHEGRLDPAFFDSMLAFRLLLEVETVRLAALARTPAQLAGLLDLLAREAAADPSRAALLTELDFDFHLSLAIASANHVYPLILNSFKCVYTSLTGEFFRRYAGGQVVAEVFDFHRRLVAAVAARDAADAARLMTATLEHGAAHLKGEIA